MTDRVACFDLDGCLVDSTRPITAAVNAGLEALGLPTQDRTSLTWFIGPPLHQSYQRLLADLGADPERAADAVAGYRDAYGPLSLELTTVVPGVPELLDDLTWRALVVTSKPTHFAAPIVEHLGLADRFEAIHGPSLEARAESKVETLGRALATAGVRAGSGTAMIGDRHHDVTAGGAHGCTTISVTWGAGGRAELAAADADHVVDTVEELARLLA